jgi:NO-binding membrane sensor protein with MHYT domain
MDQIASGDELLKRLGLPSAVRRLSLAVTAETVARVLQRRERERRRARRRRVAAVLLGAAIAAVAYVRVTAGE